jgi:hypothetical protein
VAWFALTLPALLFNYFGQGALLLRDPEAAPNVFYPMALSRTLSATCVPFSKQPSIKRCADIMSRSRTSSCLLARRGKDERRADNQRDRQIDRVIRSSRHIGTSWQQKRSRSALVVAVYFPIRSISPDDIRALSCNLA